MAAVRAPKLTLEELESRIAPSSLTGVDAEDWQRIIAGTVDGLTVPAYLGGVAYSRPVLVDIDADGDLDLFLGEEGGAIHFYQNDGTAQAPSWSFVTERYGGIDVGAAAAPWGAPHCQDQKALGLR